MFRSLLRGILSALFCLAGAVGARAQGAVEQPNVRLMLDWVVQGTHAPFFVAASKGYFKQEGVNIQIDGGKGAGNTIQFVASGTYQFGYADVPTLVKFNAQNPERELLAVYVSFDETPLVVLAKKSSGIKSPADLDGKKMNGTPGSAIYATMPILLKAVHAENVKINWQNAAPQLAGPMFMRGETAALGGFTSSMIPSVVELGGKIEDINIMRFADYGVDLYGLALMVSKQFAENNPKTVRAVVRGLNRGTKDVIADPKAAIALMTARDPTMNAEVESLRLRLALGHTLTPGVMKNGLSSVTPERMQKTIDTTIAAESLPRKPALDEVYTDRFLPSREERTPPALGQ